MHKLIKILKPNRFLYLNRPLRYASFCTTNTQKASLIEYDEDMNREIDALFKQYNMVSSPLDFSYRDATKYIKFFGTRSIPTERAIDSANVKPESERIEEYAKMKETFNDFKDKVAAKVQESGIDAKIQIDISTDGIDIKIGDIGGVFIMQQDADRIQKAFKLNSDVSFFIDGASRKNPGPAGCGISVLSENANILNLAVPLGIASNNFAEYMGLVYALCLAKIGNVKTPKIYSDSMLVVNQVKGLNKIHHPLNKLILKLIHDMILDFNEIELNYIPREFNTQADAMSKKASMLKDQPYYLTTPRTAYKRSDTLPSELQSGASTTQFNENEGASEEAVIYGEDTTERDDYENKQMNWKLRDIESQESILNKAEFETRENDLKDDSKMKREVMRRLKKGDAYNQSVVEAHELEKDGHSDGGIADGAIDNIINEVFSNRKTAGRKKSTTKNNDVDKTVVIIEEKKPRAKRTPKAESEASKKENKKEAEPKKRTSKSVDSKEETKRGRSPSKESKTDEKAPKRGRAASEKKTTTKEDKKKETTTANKRGSSAEPKKKSTKEDKKSTAGEEKKKKTAAGKAPTKLTKSPSEKTSSTTKSTKAATKTPTKIETKTKTKITIKTPTKTEKKGTTEAKEKSPTRAPRKTAAASTTKATDAVKKPRSRSAS